MQITLGDGITFPYGEHPKQITSITLTLWHKITETNTLKHGLINPKLDCKDDIFWGGGDDTE